MIVNFKKNISDMKGNSARFLSFIGQVLLWIRHFIDPTSDIFLNKNHQNEISVIIKEMP